MWRVVCNLYGTDTAVWFVCRDLYSGRQQQYVLNANGKPMPFRDETDAYRMADSMNANDVTELALGEHGGKVAFA